MRPVNHLSAGTWLSQLVCTAGTALGPVPRITAEESELVSGASDDGFGRLVDL